MPYPAFNSKNTSQYNTMESHSTSTGQTETGGHRGKTERQNVAHKKKKKIIVNEGSTTAEEEVDNSKKTIAEVYLQDFIGAIFDEDILDELDVDGWYTGPCVFLFCVHHAHQIMGIIFNVAVGVFYACGSCGRSDVQNKYM